MNGATISIGDGTGASTVKVSALPPLREELNLFPGAASIDGEPTWVLQDPVAHRFFQIGRHEFEILSRWHLGTLEALLQAIPNSAEVTAEHVEGLAEFLAKHNLFQSRGNAALKRLRDTAALVAKRDLLWLLKNYLFIRIPVVNPDNFLQRTLKYVCWLGSRTFLSVTVLVAILGVFLIQRQWEEFINALPYFFTLPGLLVMAITLVSVKVLHEFGHAWTAKHFGCRIPSMGVAMLVMWPVLYTDASDAWRLTSRKQRLLIGAAGMLTELAVAAYATLAWSFLDDGALRSGMFLLATTTWVVSLLVNLNPFMRFDGYYLASDFIGIPNLQERSFALARWQLREWLFGLREPIPEHFPRRTQRILIAYAYGTWIYRFFLFIGIALLVYYFFFKLLGIFLMLVELAWFIGKPVYTEFKVWWGYRDQFSWNAATRRSALLFGLLLALLVIPWQREIAAPALWSSGHYAYLYAPGNARVADILVQQGDSVERDQVLIQLDSPDLDYEIAQGEFRLSALAWQLNNQGFNAELQERARVISEEYTVEQARQSARLLEREKLAVRSPLDGEVRELVEPLAEGDWLRDSDFLAAIVVAGTGKVEAWIEESHLARVTTGAAGRFYADDIQIDPFEFKVGSIASASTRELPDFYQASTYGGAIAARQDPEGRLVPDHPVYHMLAESNAIPEPPRVLRGTVRLAASSDSLFSRVWQNLVTMLLRESSF